jgi:hypothetical protein
MPPVVKDKRMVKVKEVTREPGMFHPYDCVHSVAGPIAEKDTNIPAHTFPHAFPLPHL